MQYEINEKISKEFEDKLQEKYEEFYLAKLAEAKRNLEVAKVELDRAKERVEGNTVTLQKVQNDPNYIKNLYFSNYTDFNTQGKSSQYFKDLENLIK